MATRTISIEPRQRAEILDGDVLLQLVGRTTTHPAAARQDWGRASINLHVNYSYEHAPGSPTVGKRVPHSRGRISSHTTHSGETTTEEEHRLSQYPVQDSTVRPYYTHSF